MTVTNIQLHCVTPSQLLNDCTAFAALQLQLPIAVGQFTFPYKQMLCLLKRRKQWRSHRVGPTYATSRRGTVSRHYSRSNVCPIRPVLLSHVPYLTAEYTNYTYCQWITYNDCYETCSANYRDHP